MLTALWKAMTWSVFMKHVLGVLKIVFDLWFYFMYYLIIEFNLYGSFLLSNAFAVSTGEAKQLFWVD